MSFEKLIQTWNALGEKDPLWAILSHPEMEGGKWQPERFFLTGELEVALILEELHHLGCPPASGTALDFGCGVGRVTRALASQFHRTHGVDVATSMIDRARQLAPKDAGLTYHLHQKPNLALFDADLFDFVYSRLVLQHMPPDYAKAYIAELIRVTRPGGIAALQIPSHPSEEDAALLDRWLRPSARFRATISPTEDTLEVEAGQPRKIGVRVRNVSRCRWESESDTGGKIRIRLGDQWLDTRGATVQVDSGRTPIPTSLEPGDEAELELIVIAPEQGGDYLLEIDLVQEDVSWFRDKGGTTARVPVRVQGGRSREEPARPARWKTLATEISNRLGLRRRHSSDLPEAQFEMRSMTVNEVVATANEAGAELLAMQRDGTVREGWRSYFYYLRPS